MPRQTFATPSHVLVSIVVPCRNEAAYLPPFLTGVLGQQLPAGTALEVLVADGASDDGSRALLEAWQVHDARLKVVDNPRRIVSTGLNRAIAAAAGEVIVRMDVHSEYARDYVTECLAALASSGADNVGGPWRAVPDGVPAFADARVPAADSTSAGRSTERAGATQRAIAAAFQSRWVSGGARSRQLDYSGEVDTVYLGCWPRASFERFGGFDEQLVRNQDDEHNLRIRRAGGRVWQSARIRSAYRPRARIGQVLHQYWQYGYWKPFVMRKHGQAASWRHLVPGGFVLALLLALALALAGGVLGLPLLMLPMGLLAGLYGAAVLCLATVVARGAGLDAAAAFRVPVVIAAYHLGYGAGALLGACDVLRRRSGRYTALTR